MKGYNMFFHIVNLKKHHYIHKGNATSHQVFTEIANSKYNEYILDMKYYLFHKYCINFLFTIYICFFVLCGTVSASTDTTKQLCKDKLETVFDSGEYNDPCPIRLFADDDYGLKALFQYFMDNGFPQISSPYQLFPKGMNALFIGIISPKQDFDINAEELLEFASQGNIAIVLTSQQHSNGMLKTLGLAFDDIAPSDMSSTDIRSIKKLKQEWQYWNEEHTIVWRKCDEKGRIIVIGDSFAFSQKRFFGGNNTVLSQLLKLFPDSIEALRIIQRKRYVQDGNRAIFSSSYQKIQVPPEDDPAFAPAFTDSNNEKKYKMTQQEFFSLERYYELPSTENSEYQNMMRVRTYDSFVAPDVGNSKAWHFVIRSPQETELKATPDFTTSGYKIMKVATMFKPNIPPEQALLASISPDSRLLSIQIQKAAVKDPREQEIEARVSSQRRKVEQLQDGMKRKSSNFGLFQRPNSQEDAKGKILLEEQTLLFDEEAELKRIKVQNGRPDIDNLGSIVPDVHCKVYSDSLHNFRVETNPPVKTFTGYAFVYHIAYRDDYLRNDTREFKANLIPADLTISQWQLMNELSGIHPCQVSHEKEALKRLANGRRHEWFYKSKSPKQVGKEYLPKIISDALNGKDVKVRPLLTALTEDLTQYNDTIIQLKDEFNTFTEAMVYWRNGVCRHRARTGFMILNNIGIPARLVTTRSHAFVEIFVPTDHGGFWTQVNFGGGFGNEGDSLFPNIKLPVAYITPTPVPVPSPTPSEAPAVQPSSPASNTTTQPQLPKNQDGLLFVLFKILIYISLGVMAIIMIVLAIIWILTLASQRHQDNRIPVTSLTDFMLSQSEILDHDLKHGEFRGVALTLLEAILPRLPTSTKDNYQQLYNDLQKKDKFSRKEYLALFNQVKGHMKTIQNN